MAQDNRIVGLTPKSLLLVIALAVFVVGVYFYPVDGASAGRPGPADPASGGNVTYGPGTTINGSNTSGGDVPSGSAASGQPGKTGGNKVIQGTRVRMAAPNQDNPLKRKPIPKKPSRKDREKIEEEMKKRGVDTTQPWGM